MTLTVSHWVKAYELANAKMPDENSLRFIEYMDKVGQQFRTKGAKDAALDCAPRTKEAFTKSSLKHCSDDPEWAQLFAVVTYAYYMDGYRKEATPCPGT